MRALALALLPAAALAKGGYYGGGSGDGDPWAVLYVFGIGLCLVGAFVGVDVARKWLRGSVAGRPRRVGCGNCDRLLFVLPPERHRPKIRCEHCRQVLNAQDGSMSAVTPTLDEDIAKGVEKGRVRRAGCTCTEECVHECPPLGIPCELECNCSCVLCDCRCRCLEDCLDRCQKRGSCYATCKCACKSCKCQSYAGCVVM